MPSKTDPKESMIIVINEILSAINTTKFTQKFKEKRLGLLLELTETIPDKKLRKQIYDELIQIMLVENQGVIKTRLNMNLIPLIEVTTVSIGKTFIHPRPEIIKSPTYIKECNNHSDIKHLIERTEKMVLDAPNYQDKLHKILDKGILKGSGSRHAHITDNFSIIYVWNTKEKTLVFERLMSHTELDQT